MSRTCRALTHVIAIQAHIAHVTKQHHNPQESTHLARLREPNPHKVHRENLACAPSITAPWCAGQLDSLPLPQCLLRFLHISS